jgi:hypothetical protein
MPDKIGELLALTEEALPAFPMPDLSPRLVNRTVSKAKRIVNHQEQTVFGLKETAVATDNSDV